MKNYHSIKGSTLGKVIHGHRNTRLYSIWSTMKKRCYNENCDRYRYYGKRGIRVCVEWRFSFQNFYEWAITNGYNDSLTIDRRNPNKDYEPSNCRWITNKEQQNNKTNNRRLEYKGENHTLAEWSEITQINVKTLWSRLENGWDVNRTLSTPARMRRII